MTVGETISLAYKVVFQVDQKELFSSTQFPVLTTLNTFSAVRYQPLKILRLLFLWGGGYWIIPTSYETQYSPDGYWDKLLHTIVKWV